MAGKEKSFASVASTQGPGNQGALHLPAYLHIYPHRDWIFISSSAAHLAVIDKVMNDEISYESHVWKFGSLGVWGKKIDCLVYFSHLHASLPPSFRSTPEVWSAFQPSYQQLMTRLLLNKYAK